MEKDIALQGRCQRPPPRAGYHRWQGVLEVDGEIQAVTLWHVIGKPPTAEEAIATLVNISSLDRSEEEILSLPRIVPASGGILIRFIRIAIAASSRMSSCCKTSPYHEVAVAALVKLKQMLMVVSPKSPSSTF